MFEEGAVMYGGLIISFSLTRCLKKGVLCTVVQLSEFSLTRCLKKGVFCTVVQVSRFSLTRCLKKGVLCAVAWLMVPILNINANNFDKVSILMYIYNMKLSKHPSYNLSCVHPVDCRVSKVYAL